MTLNCSGVLDAKLAVKGCGSWDDKNRKMGHDAVVSIAVSMVISPSRSGSDA